MSIQLDLGSAHYIAPRLELLRQKACELCVAAACWLRAICDQRGMNSRCCQCL